MEDFILYLKIGLFHVLDFRAYDHILFLIVLTVFYSFRNWKNLIWLVTAFTIGHTISLSLSAFNIINVKMSVIEFLIPLTILITAIYNIITIKKSRKSIYLTAFFALIFGLIHGFGFSNYFQILMDDTEDKLLPLIEFAIGIEIAQLILVICIVLLSYVVINLFKQSKRDWILVVSSVVIGIVIPMLIERKFW